MAAQPNDSVVIKKLVQGVQSQTATSRTQADSALTNPNQSYFNKSVKQLRSETKLLKAIRQLARVNGDVSAAVATMVRLAHTELRVRVYDSAHLLSAEGNNLARAVINRMSLQFDYTTGFDDRMSFKGVQESLLRSIPLTGACALELVLDKQRLPYRLQPVSVESLRFKTSKEKLGSTYKTIPYQVSNDGDIELNIPSFFYASLDQDLESAFPFSPMEPAVNTAIYHEETMEEIRRTVQRSGHSRLMVKLVLEQVLKAAPIDLRSDPVKLSAWVEQQRQEIVRQVEELSPESALVFFDSVESEYLTSTIGTSSDYNGYMQLVDTLLATSAKTPASLLGKRHQGGSQNTSSTESLLFIKTAAGLHNPVETVLSRALTLAIRLYGFDGYVECDFSTVDLRPEEELAAFRAMKQAQVLELLSVGFLGDDEAAEMLDVGPRPPGAPPLSGTFFYKPDASAAASPEAMNNTDPVRRATTTDTPKAAGGASNKKQV